MNKNSVLEWLRMYLSDILCHSEFIPGLLSLITGSGFEEKFFRLLVARLQMLSSRGAKAVIAKEFESIGGGLFSMHLSGRGFNIRILYGFLPNQQPVLLSSFHERAGKKVTDYSAYIPEAQARLEQMRKEFENGR